MRSEKSLGAAWLLVVAIMVPWVASGQALDDHARRATVTSDRAREIARQLFPDKCGSDGCFITFDDRRGCPFEFVVLFPIEGVAPGEPSGAFVTLDKSGVVVDVSSIQRSGCRNATT